MKYLIAAFALLTLTGCPSTTLSVKKQAAENCMMEVFPQLTQAERTDAVKCFEPTLMNFNTGKSTAKDDPQPVACERAWFCATAGEFVRFGQCYRRNLGKIFTGE